MKISLALLFASLALAVQAQDLTAYKIVPADWVCQPPPKTNYIFNSYGSTNLTITTNIIWFDAGGIESVTRSTNTTPQAHWVYAGESTNRFISTGGGTDSIIYHSNLVIDVRCDGTNRVAILESTKKSVLLRDFQFQRVYGE